LATRQLLLWKNKRAGLNKQWNGSNVHCASPLNVTGEVSSSEFELGTFYKLSYCGRAASRLVKPNQDSNVHCTSLSAMQVRVSSSGVQDRDLATRRLSCCGRASVSKPSKEDDSNVHCRPPTLQVRVSSSGYGLGNWHADCSVEASVRVSKPSKG
jgi:hypothetical protein